MLVLCRKTVEKVVVGDDITLTVIEVQGNRVRVGIHAPGQVRILRGELVGGENLPVPDSDMEEKLPASGTHVVPEIDQLT
jgi:carbon storage regulator CsrA